MKAFIAGADGQLGRALAARLGRDVVFAGGRGELDVTDRHAVLRAVTAAAPDVVLNAAAFNAVDAAESEPALALAVNAGGPLHLALAAREAGATLVHVSTDYVFDGARRTPYEEDAAPRPLSAYGMSKLAGEMAVMAAAEDYLVVRTSGVLGRGASRAKGGSFVERVLARARAGEALRVVDDQEFSPTLAEDLAGAIVALLGARVRGIAHVTNSGSCTWADLALAALDEARVSARLKRIRSAELNQPARRPAYSVLANRRYTAAGLPALPHWRDAVRRLVAAPA